MLDEVRGHPTVGPPGGEERRAEIDWWDHGG
jgi:hypothetical protein